MPASENQDSRGRLLTYLFWAGISVALFAALLLIVAGSSTSGLRFAAILAILAVVAIGISVTLRRDVASIKVDLEETMLDEMDMLRGDVRADITTAARATHRALSEKVAHLHESLEQVRQQVEAVSAGELEQAAPRPVVGPPPGMRAVAAVPASPNGGGPGVVQRTETVRVTTRTIVDPDEEQYGRPQGRPPVDADDDMYADRGPRQRRDDQDERQPAVHVGEGHGRNLRNRAAREREAPPSEFELAARRAWSDTSDDLADDPRWSGMRAGDRWAEVRQDENGREVRMAERRAAIRTDETGTHLRVVDRWSTIREDHPQPQPTDTFENTGETRAQRRAREEAAQSDRERPASRLELPSSRGYESRGAGWDSEMASAGGRRRAPDASVDEERDEPRSRRHAEPDEPAPARRNQADDYRSFTPRPLDAHRLDDDTPSRRWRARPDDVDERPEPPGARADEVGRSRRSGERFWHDDGARHGSESGSDRHAEPEAAPADWDASGRRAASEYEGYGRGHYRTRHDDDDQAEYGRGRADRQANGWDAQSWEGRDSGERREATPYRRADDYDVPHRADAQEVIPAQRRPERVDRSRAADSWERGGGHDDDLYDSRRGGRTERPAARDDRDDDRWEREPSGPRRSTPRRYDFEVTDERWH